MLKLPEMGFHTSRGAHNVDLDVLCDWIEASVLFTGERLSKSDVIDNLLEEGVYDEQDFAKQLIDDAWGFLLRRQAWLGSSAALKGNGSHLDCTHPWQELPAHSFCLILTLRAFYAEWSKTLGNEYVTQGDLFERFAAEALRNLGWDVHRTGWSGKADVVDFQSAVQALADALREPSQVDRLWDDAKDDGLDLVCHKAFHDDRGGAPVFLVQCASGRNWEKKLATPSLKLWQDTIRFSGPIAKGIAMPFNLFEDTEFRHVRMQSEGVVWDRYRLLAAGRANKNWLSPSLITDLLAWIGPAIATLPAV